ESRETVQVVVVIQTMHRGDIGLPFVGARQPAKPRPRQQSNAGIRGHFLDQHLGASYQFGTDSPRLGVEMRSGLSETPYVFAASRLNRRTAPASRKSRSGLGVIHVALH